MLKKQLTNAIEEIFFRSWWVVLFVLACYFCYEQGLRKKDRERAMLQRQYEELSATRKRVMSLQQELQRQVNSQGDVASLELILMKDLGMIPEGQIKVLFTNSGIK